MYFAQLDFFRRVLKVIVADQEAADKLPGMWIDCNNVKNQPIIRSTYDYERNAFIYPKPYPSWVLNEQNYRWEPPIKMPENTPGCIWDEEKGLWYSEKLKKQKTGTKCYITKKFYNI